MPRVAQRSPWSEGRSEHRDSAAEAACGSPSAGSPALWAGSPVTQGRLKMKGKADKVRMGAALHTPHGLWPQRAGGHLPPHAAMVLTISWELKEGWQRQQGSYMRKISTQSREEKRQVTAQPGAQGDTLRRARAGFNALLPPP